MKSITLSLGRQIEPRSSCDKCNSNCMSGDEVSPSKGSYAFSDDLKKEVLSFEFPALVERLEEKLKLDLDEANLLFRDGLRFLYLCGTMRETPLSPPPNVDLMWHEFILHTRDYAAFCQRFFGHFIHHVPRTRKSRGNKGSSSNLTTTIQAAQEAFGKLSPNWVVGTASCGKCNQCEGDCTPIYD